MSEEFLDFSPEDFKRTVLLEPDWYPFLIRKHEIAFSKEKNKKMHVYEMIGVGSGPQENVIVQKWFLEDQKFRMIPFLNSVGAKIGEKGATGLSPSRAAGKVIEVFIGRREADGTEYNDPKMYRPYTGPPIASTTEATPA